MLSLSLLLAGCKEDDSTWLVKTTTDPIEIYGVVDPANYDAPISAAQIEQTIKLTGKNLGSVSSIMINDVEVEMQTEAVVVNGAIYIQIPYKAPVDVDNKIKLTDEYGNKAETALTVSLPAMAADAMDCEWAAPGTDAIIEGNYFDLYRMDDAESSVTFGSLNAVIKSATKTQVTVTVPAGATRDSEIKLTSVTGESVVLPFKYRDTQWLQADFNATNRAPWTKWSDFMFFFVNDASSMGGPAGIDGIFFGMMGTYPAGWDAEWGIYDDWSGNNIPADINTNRSAYYLKFEVWIPDNTAYVPSYGIRFQFGSDADGGDNRHFWYNPDNSTAPVRGKWTTVKVPVETIFNDGGKQGSFQHFRIACQCPDGVSRYVAYAIDNPRYGLKALPE